MGRVAAVPPLWILPDAPDALRVSALAAELDLDPTLCALLVGRGVADRDGAKHFLRPLLDHLHPAALLPDASRAADRIVAAIRAGETILAHGDYDVDGICGAALLTRVLTSLGGRVRYIMPSATSGVVCTLFVVWNWNIHFGSSSPTLALLICFSGLKRWAL